MLMSPELLRQSSESRVDPLSASLERVAARCVITGGFTVGGAWAVRFPTPERLKIAAQVSGSCVLRCEGTSASVRLGPGDVAVLDGRHPIVVGSDEQVTPRDASLVLAGQDHAMVDLGGDDAVHRVVQVGGHIEANAAGTAMLRQILPPLLHIGADARRAVILRGLVEQLFVEVSQPGPGAAFATERLAQLVLVHVLREFLAGAPDLPPGRLRVLTDEPLAPAVRRMHDEPGRPWRLEDLAKVAAMSRTTFATRFRSIAGQPPLAYLADLRMELAEQRLRDGLLSVSELATASGYSSVSAFSAAFKRATGRSPRRARAAVFDAEVS